MNKNVKIAVGLSGGVDSSVAALLLKQAGYDVFALFMQNWHDTTGTLHGDCEWEEDKFVAEMVAKKIGIPFHFVDLSDTYRKRVVDYMFNEYEKGRTPNPDVLCNREIKFDAFLKCALELGADYVATGHYCRKEEFVNDKGETIYRLIAGADGNKDQSYFLCQLSQEQLSKALFPIGEIIKPEVRRLAKEADLPSADKKDSQGICFVGKVDLPIFLQQKLKPKEGKVVEIFEDFYRDIDCHASLAMTECGRPAMTGDASLAMTECGRPAMTGDASLAMTECDCPAMIGEQTVIAMERSERSNLKIEELKALSTPITYKESYGKVIGKHQGAQFYTIGQRKGLNIGGHKEPIFIISIDIENNIIYVGEGQNHPGLYRKALHILPDEVHWVRPDLECKIGEEREYLIRIRYRQPLQKGKFFSTEEGIYLVFDEPQRGITPGQFAAWYDQNQELIGSGVINE